jgi:hypothetical protein
LVAGCSKAAPLNRALCGHHTLESSMELSEITLPLILSAWGAILSSILAFIKIAEALGNRFKIGTDYMFRGDPGSGNEISIQNLSGKPVLLTYIQLFYKKESWFPFQKKYELWSPEDELLNSKIESNSSKTFNFTRGDYFSTNDRIIYARLYFAGDKKIIKRIN